MAGDTDRITVRKGWSFARDEGQAVAELAERIRQPRMDVVIFFCSSQYDLDRLGAELQRAFDCPLVGCTTAGEVTSDIGYREGGIVGVSLSSPELAVHLRVIHPLNRFDPHQAEGLARGLREELALPDGFRGERMFGLLLVDGLSMLEEQVIASLYNHLGSIPIIGGSAGDDLAFRETWVYRDGAFISNAAAFALFETTLPFRVFRVQHFEPTDTRLVITEADVATRTVTEINGGPAAQEYAKAVGLEVEDLTSQVFAAYPVMLRIGGEYFVRSIQKANPDGSLTFYCAIDNGLVLTVAKGNGLLDNLRQNLDRLAQEMPEGKLIIGCDCILRRLELQQKGGLEEAQRILEKANFIGFSTYGEQFNGIHVNQTLTGVAIGG